MAEWQKSFRHLKCPPYAYSWCHALVLNIAVSMCPVGTSHLWYHAITACVASRKERAVISSALHIEASGILYSGFWIIMAQKAAKNFVVNAPVIMLAGALCHVMPIPWCPMKWDSLSLSVRSSAKKKNPGFCLYWRPYAMRLTCTTVQAKCLSASKQGNGGSNWTIQHSEYAASNRLPLRSFRHNHTTVTLRYVV